MVFVEVIIVKGRTRSPIKRILIRPVKYRRLRCSRGRTVYPFSPSKKQQRRYVIYQNKDLASGCCKNIPQVDWRSPSMTAVFLDWVYTWGLPKLRETAQRIIISRELAHPRRYIFNSLILIEGRPRFSYDEEAWLR